MCSDRNSGVSPMYVDTGGTVPAEPRIGDSLVESALIPRSTKKLRLVGP